MKWDLFTTGMCLYEEPCPYWQIEKTRAVREACAIRARCGGEIGHHVGAMMTNM